MQYYTRSPRPWLRTRLHTCSTYLRTLAIPTTNVPYHTYIAYLPCTCNTIPTYLTTHTIYPMHTIHAYVVMECSRGQTLRNLQKTKYLGKKIKSMDHRAEINVYTLTLPHCLGSCLLVPPRSFFFFSGLAKRAWQPSTWPLAYDGAMTSASSAILQYSP